MKSGKSLTIDISFIHIINLSFYLEMLLIISFTLSYTSYITPSERWATSSALVAFASGKHRGNPREDQGKWWRGYQGEV